MVKKSFLFSGLFVLLCLIISCKSPSSPEEADPTVSSVAVTSANSTLQVGQTEQMTATVTMSDGTTKAASGTWGSDNMDVAAVDQSGLVTAVAAGSATIYIDVNASSLMSVNSTSSVADTATNNSSGGKETVKSLKTKAALRGKKGLGKAGRSNYKDEVYEDTVESDRLSDSGGIRPTSTVRGSKSLTVEAPTVVSVTVTSPNSSILVDQTEQMTATVTMSDGSTKSGVGTWISGNENVATVNQSGLVRGVGPGGVDIKFKNTAGKQGVKTLTVRSVWSRSGTGANVFDMPTYVERVKIIGDYRGTDSIGDNFVVWVDNDLLVNEILGTYWGSTHYEGTHLTTGGVVQVKYSNGVYWSLTEVPVTTALTRNERKMLKYSGKSMENSRQYQIYLQEAAKQER